MKTRRTVFAGLALAFGLVTQPAIAPGQTPSVTRPPIHPTTTSDAIPEYIQEFFLSEAVRSQDRGELQFTAGVLVSKNHHSAADGASAGLDFEYGLTDRLQLSVEVPYGIHSTATSEMPGDWSTLDTGVLYQFMRSSHPFALSAGVGAGLPLNSQAETSFVPEVVMARVLGVVQIHASFEPEISENNTSLAYNVAAVGPWPHHLYPTLEFNGRRNDAINSFYVTPGLYRRLPHRLEFGVGVPIGAGSHSSPIGAAFKMTWEVGGHEDQD